MIDMDTLDLRNRLFFAAIAAFVAASSCKGAPTATASDGDAASSAPERAPVPVSRNPGADPCAIVTQKDATTALGSDPGPGEAVVTPAGTGRCTYDSNAGNLMATITPNQTQAAFTRVHDMTAKSSRADAFAEVGEVGHGAFSTWGGPMASIQFYKGSTAVYIMLTLGARKPSPKSQVTALAAAAAGRI